MVESVTSDRGEPDKPIIINSHVRNDKVGIKKLLKFVILRVQSSTAKVESKKDELFRW